MRLSGYNKNIEDVYKNHTYITKKEDYDEQSKKFSFVQTCYTLAKFHTF